VRRLAFVCLALATATAHAAHPLITEDTGTLGPGRWQLEGIGEHEKDRITRQREDVNLFVLSRGYAESADWQVAVPWHRAREDEIGDVSLDLKWRFHERGRFSLGLKPGATLPTGDWREDRGKGKATVGALLIASYEPGPFAFHAQAGYRWNRNRLGERKSLTHFSAAATWQLGPVKLVVDAARDTSPDPAASESERYVVLGAIWAIGRNFDLDAGVKTGHGGAALDEALLLGATVRW
jgi:hypothetical protein